MRLRLAFCLTLLLLPIAAFANIYVPSLVEIINSPLAWSIYGVTLVITIPVILIISAVETFAVKRSICKGTGRKVFIRLCVINAITSLLRIPTFSHDIIWPVLAVAFALTIPSEALILRYYLTQQLDVKSMRRAFALSTQMNTASYAILAIVVLGLIYIPELGTKNPQAIKNASGSLILNPGDEARVFDIRKKQFTIGIEDSLGNTEYADCCAAASDRSLMCLLPVDSPVGRELGDETVVRRWISGNRWCSEEIGRIKRIQAPAAVSSDGSLILCDRGGGWVIYNRLTGHQIKPKNTIGDVYSGSFSPDKRYLAINSGILINTKTGDCQNLDGAYDPAFNPKGSQLAWADGSSIAIYDYNTHKRSIIRLRIGTDPKGGIAWSPNGKYIAYACVNNPFVSSGWVVDIRILDISTGLSSTIARQVFTSGRPADLLWIE